MPVMLQPDYGLRACNVPEIDFSDFLDMDLNADRARFSRPIVDGSGYANCTPGGRIRFRSNATSITFRLFYNNLVTRPDTYNDVSAVLVDGAVFATFTSPGRVAARKDQTITFGSEQMRTIELLLPYCAGVEFQGIQQTPGALLLPCVPRPALSLLALGDSITHNFSASAAHLSWPFLLGVAKRWQVRNLGYGGRTTVPSDGTVAGSYGTDFVTVLLGHNDFRAQTPLATFKAQQQALQQNLRAANPDCRIIVITPTWTNVSLAIPIESYRVQIRAAFGEIADGNALLIEGEPLAGNSTGSFPDGVHPNDAASAQMAASIGGSIG
ncbi:SGNH/GDSL hydrolase family protein [Rhizobium binae]|uniref:SGNH/GDSL hydrolase family protein n=1 Tax=Rhizobium binae TaxID=1138190 RepID=UPI001C840338|nr:SGNH/GDSL hydrolase family protein [Rhizobium binae]MBX4967186.1 SGNH/GDSL hydrolase family protein [Rhizobium binae]